MAQAKRTSGRKPTRDAGSADHADATLRKVVEENLAAVRTINELRAPLWEALTAELDGGKKKSFTPRAARLGRQMEKAFQQYRKGEINRADIGKSYRRALSELRRDFEKRSVDALWKHTKAHPSFAELLQAARGDAARESRSRIVTDRYLGLLFERPVDVPSDVGTVQQGLGDEPPPQPLGICSDPPFAFRDARTSSQLISLGNISSSTPGFGSFLIMLMGDLAGGASGHALVGADFAIPAGFTNINVTADINWSYSGWCFAIGGVGLAGANLVLWIQNPAGAAPIQTSSPLFSLVSPVIWGNSSTGSGNTVITGSLATPDAAARTIRIFAGASGHAEAGATFAAGASTIANGTVTRICISAT